MRLTAIPLLTAMCVAASMPTRAEALTPAPAQAAAPAGQIPVETVRADFADLYRMLRDAHFDLYARAPRAAYDRLYARIANEIRHPMDRAEVLALFQRFVAFGRIAHARIDDASEGFAAYRKATGRIFPLAVRPQGKRIFVTGNGSGVAAIAPGDEVVTLNGQSAASWIARAAANVSADTPYMLGAMLEWSFPAIVWRAAGPAERFDLRVRRGGRMFNVTVPARTSAEIGAALVRQPRLELSWEKREARMLDGGIAYLRPGPSYNVEGAADAMYDNRAYKAFIDRAFDTFLSAKAAALLIDLRDNPGGDASFSDHMIGWFANRPFKFNSRFRIKVSEATRRSNRERMRNEANDSTGIGAQLAAAYDKARDGMVIDFPTPPVQPRGGTRFTGQVYALVNRHSYSNTVTIAAILQDDRFATILGEETSDLATTYGAMESFRLPRTGIEVGYPKAYIVRPSGSTAARGAVPDIAIATPIVETPDDPVLRRAVEIVRAGVR